MAIDARIRELDNRHQSLDAAIRDETSRPAGDSVRLLDLKRKKLKLKEEIQTLRATV